MNQDQVKAKLLEIEPEIEEFFVIFSGKQSKKVNGLYRPETREIIIHNRNFEDDNQLLYTAVHEFAHHVHFTRSSAPVSNRAHTTEFRAIFHELLARAEALGVYQNLVDAITELRDLANGIRERFMRVNGDLMKDFGHALMEAEKLCRKYSARFEDFVERALCLPKQTASTLMKFKVMDLPPDIGYENMKTLAGIRNLAARTDATLAFMRGESPDMIKQTLRARAPSVAGDPRKKLLSEKKRIEKTLENLSKRLNQIFQELETLPEAEPDVSEEGATV
jgi:hypothetical protein